MEKLARSEAAFEAGIQILYLLGGSWDLVGFRV